MKSYIVIILLLGFSCHATEIWYQTEISTYLIPPIQNAYVTLQRNIMNRLPTIDLDLLVNDSNAVGSLHSTMYCEIKKILQYLDTSVTTSNNIRIKVENKLATITSDILAKETEIARIDDQIRNLNGNIQAKQSQINSAEQTVRQAESAVNAAQNALSQAEREVEDAKLCAGLIGRRKRFLGSVWNSIQNSVLKPIESAVNTAGGAINSALNTAGNAIVDNVVKPVCSVINFQQLDNAQRNVENKKNELVRYRNQLQTLNNELNSLRNDLNIYRAQSFNLNYQLNQLKDSLVELPNEQHIIVLVYQKLTTLVSHIRPLFAGSVSFVDALSTIVDFEITANILNSIYDELDQNKLMAPSTDSKISREQANQAKMKLQSLNVALSSIQFNGNSIRCSA